MRATAAAVVLGSVAWCGLAASPAGAVPSPTPAPTSTPTSAPTDTSSVEPTAEPTSPSGDPTADSPTSPGASVPATVGPSIATSPTLSSVEPSDEPEDGSTSDSDVPAESPGIAPASRSSGIPLGSIVIALCVLAAATLLAVRIARQGARDPTPQLEASAPVDPSAVAFLVALGRAMIDSGASVTQVGASLRRVAAINGLTGAEVVVLPTALFVSLPGRDDVQTAIAPAGARLRLDQVDAVFMVVDDAENGDVEASTGIERLRAAREMPPSFSWGLRLVGYPLMAAGLVLILRGSMLDLLVACGLATGVGLLQQYRSRVPSAYLVFLPVVSSFLVAAAVLLLVRAGADIGLYAPVIAPLITFLPGALLTTAVIELATGQMVAGAGRLAAGVMQLVLLAIGIIAAGQLVGVPGGSFVDEPPTLGVVAPWLGVAVFGVGVVLANSARPSSLGWIVLILYVAYAGQTLGGLLLGSQLSSFAGALVMTPVAMIAASQRNGPPTLVTFLPAFWLLVPGALGLAGVTKYLGENRVDGVTSLVSAGTTMIGIAFGVLLGLAIGSLVGLASGVTLTPGRHER